MLHRFQQGVRPNIEKKVVSVTQKASKKVILMSHSPQYTCVNMITCQVIVYSRKLRRVHLTKKLVEKIPSTSGKSRMITYRDVNPDLYTQNVQMYEPIYYKRLSLTLFRVGAHRLKIETGRRSRIAREQRLTTCDIIL